MKWKEILSDVISWLSTNGIRLVFGLIVLFILFKIANKLAKTIKKAMEKKGVERTIYTVTYHMIQKGLKIVFFVLFLSFVGVDTAGIGAAIASLGIAIGLALQGSLSNLAGGILLIVLRPFKLGDYIEAQGESGTVEEINIFYTYITTVDNKVVMIPNGSLLNNNITNYSKKDVRRLDMEFTLRYDQDVILAQKLLREMLDANEMVLKTPEAFVGISKYGENAVVLVTKSWVKSSDYWTMYYAMLESVKLKFDQSGLAIPDRKLDVHLNTTQSN